MSNDRPIQKDAYALILEAIDVGVYKPGDRLVESELADRFGVSRTPIREALQRLETQSLLSRDGRSLVVASLDHNQLSELYVVRSELEGLAARLAASHATVEEMKVLRRGTGAVWLWHRWITTSYLSSMSCAASLRGWPRDWRQAMRPSKR